MELEKDIADSSFSAKVHVWDFFVFKIFDFSSRFSDLIFYRSELSIKTWGNTWRWDSGEIFGFFTARMMSKCLKFVTVGSAARGGIDPSDVHHHIKTFWWRIDNSGYAPGCGAEAEVAQQIR